ncbi:major facilitator transporter [Pandoraea eparura]|uniref:Major facilitator transporter n=1 Tax=Pandoraea eparura TaxID=2508291 RepID=A0A5E4T785_9BURK|nr:major facilitator transporter [Pandoraea eparura]
MLTLAMEKAGLSRPKVIAATTLGTALAFYDFTIYSVFAIQIGQLFFPSASPVNQFLLSIGVFGFRPSPGLVPNARRLLGWMPISVVGPMGRDVEEAALQLAATAGFSSGDPLAYDIDAPGFTALPRPDLVTLAQANPALKSIVTHPPIFDSASENPSGMSSV